MAKSKQSQKDDWEEVPAADDWEEVSVNPSEARAKASKEKTASAALAQNFTAGHTPQLVGGLATLGGKIQDIIQGPVINPRTGEKIPRVDYLSARDATSKELNQAMEDNPGTYLGTTLASGLATPLGGPANSLKAMAARGIVGGALYNPGDKEGKLDPLQLGERSLGGAIGGIVNPALGGLGKKIGGMARSSRVAEEMQEPGFAQKMQGKVESAAKGLQEKYVSPRAKAAREVLKGKEIKVRPDILDDADAPGLREALQARTPLAQKKAKEAAMLGTGGAIPKAPGDELATLKGDVADRIRRRLDRDGWKQKGALATPETIKSAEGKVRAANILRDLREKAAPELSKNFDEQEYALGLKRELLNKSQSPQSLLTGQFWGDMGSKLTDVDAMAGTGLRELGEDLQGARYLLGQRPLGQELTGLSKVTDSLIRPGVDFASYVSRLPDNIINNRAMKNRSLSEAEIRAILESISRGRSSDE